MNAPQELPGQITVLEAALRCGFDLKHVCGGKARCTTCEVKIVSGEVSRPLGVERDLLYDRVDKQQRLGCQARVIGDVEIALPEYTTSIDHIFDSIPGVVVSPQSIRRFKHHQEMEADRDLKNPFYIFRRRYATTQEMQSRRQERHRMAQDRMHPQEGERQEGERRNSGRRRDRDRRRRRERQVWRDRTPGQALPGRPAPHSDNIPPEKKE